MADEHKLISVPFRESFWPYWLKWCPTSLKHLLTAESQVLSSINNMVDLYFVPLLKNRYIRTLFAYKFKSNEDANYNNKVPIVLIHGMGAGVGLWCKNIDKISDYRRLYAMDVLGFALSSRPDFPTDAKDVEEMFTDSLEDWRKSVGLDKFILLGHSMGGYLAYAYAIKHPENIRHLILADPWGFSVYDDSKFKAIRESFVKRLLFKVVTTMNPLAMVRVSGPFGHGLIRRVRPDLGSYFNETSEENSPYLDDQTISQSIYDYIYHCNAQCPSGETAFKNMSMGLGWAKYPMEERSNELQADIPITFLYGEESWMDVNSALHVKQNRSESYVDIKIIPECGHHIYAEDADYFNQVVNDICFKVDENKDTVALLENLQFIEQKQQSASRHRTPKFERTSTRSNAEK